MIIKDLTKKIVSRRKSTSRSNVRFIVNFADYISIAAGDAKVLKL